MLCREDRGSRAPKGAKASLRAASLAHVGCELRSLILLRSCNVYASRDLYGKGGAVGRNCAPEALAVPPPLELGRTQIVGLELVQTPGQALALESDRQGMWQ